MTTLLWNIGLALIWALMIGKVTPSTLTTGFIFGYLVLLLLQPSGRRSSYFRKVPQTAAFLIWFIKEVIVSNLRVAYDVVTPTHHARPGNLAIPLDVKTPAEITLLANLITLTPGTLSLDVSEDRKTLYIHAMFIDDPERLKREIKDGMERRVKELFR